MQRIDPADRSAAPERCYTSDICSVDNRQLLGAVGRQTERFFAAANLVNGLSEITADRQFVDRTSVGLASRQLID